MRALKLSQPGKSRGTGCTLDLEMQKKLSKCLIECTPDQLQFDFALWKRAAVQELIDHFFWYQDADSLSRRLWAC